VKVAGLLFRGRTPLAPVEAPADDRLKEHMVGDPRHADPETEVDLPLRRDIQIERRNKLLCLIRERIESSYRSETTVVLQAESYDLGEVPRDLRIGREFPSSPGLGTGIGLLESGID